MICPFLSEWWFVLLCTNIYYSGNVCLWCYLLTNPFSCLETAMGRRKYHRGKRVRISGVQWCLSQVCRIIYNFFKSHSSDCKRKVEQTIHPPWYSNDLNEFPVYHQWNIKVSVHPHTGKSLRADFRFLPWNRSVVFWIGTFTLFFRRNASSMLPYIQQVMKPDGLMVIY